MLDAVVVPMLDAVVVGSSERLWTGLAECVCGVYKIDPAARNSTLQNRPVERSYFCYFGFSVASEKAAAASVAVFYAGCSIAFLMPASQPLQMQERDSRYWPRRSDDAVSSLFKAKPPDKE